MSNNGIITKRLQTVAVGLLLTCAAGLATAGPQALSQAEAISYLQWLHSLEAGAKARVSAGLEEATFMFPFDQPAWDIENPRPYRHLSISKAVTELESAWNSRSNGSFKSTLMALANARNYANLSEYDSARVWYDLAAALDTTGSFGVEIARESLACAISVRDTLAIAENTTNLLGASDLAGRTDEVVLTYRWLLTLQDRDSVEHLTQKLASHPDIMTSRLCFWHAFALEWLGHRTEALAQLRQLVMDGGLSNGLSEGQRGWVMKAVPDAFFLLGSREVARELYTTLAGSSILELKLWGKYQVAGLDFLNANYLSAGNGFQEVCDGTRFGSWQDHACAMVPIVRELQRIKGEGAPYGVASFYSP